MTSRNVEKLEQYLLRWSSGLLSGENFAEAKFYRSHLSKDGPCTLRIPDNRCAVFAGSRLQATKFIKELATTMEGNLRESNEK